MLWNSSDNNFIKEKLYRYTKSNKLFRIRKGIYSKDKNFEKNELATKIFTPSYISFETVLAKEGLIFQYYSQIFSASYQTKKITILNQEYVYRKIKNEILVNTFGIENKNSYSVATKERAFLDMIYINTRDNFRAVPIILLMGILYFEIENDDIIRTNRLMYGSAVIIFFISVLLRSLVIGGLT